MFDGMMAETINITGHGGDQIAAYFARPLGPGPYPGVVVVHHMPGWDAASKEITRTFAVNGYAAICPHLHYRAGAGAPSDEAAAAVRAAGGVPDERFLGDAEGAMRFLRSLTYSNGRVGVIGYCSGGRQAFLAACRLRVDAAVDCYGAFIVNAPPAEVGLKTQPIAHLAERLSCPLLGLFGAEDRFPSPDDTARLEALLAEHGKTYEFKTYPQAGHAFFAVDRSNYRPDAALDGWGRVLDFFGRHLVASSEPPTARST